MRISVIFGTRPEAIKLAPVILGLNADPRFDCRVCITAQHRQMLDQILQVFKIKPDVDLNLMRSDQTLAGLTARAIEALDGYLAADKPDLVLAQGDTTTVLCAALAAFYRRIPFGHVEAGLRTGNLQAPWPEEANRVLTTRIASIHFAPTPEARGNLLKEGVPPEAIHVTGNTVIDALFMARDLIHREPPAIPGLPDGRLACLGDRRMVLITGHRRENFGEGFEQICGAIAELADRFPDVEFIYPVHLNPNVREPVQRILGAKACPPPRVGEGRDERERVRGEGASCAPTPSAIKCEGRSASNICLIEPLSYLPFVALMERSTLILTDSGGVQEEAPSLGKPVLVMRETTERPEAVTAGTVRLVGTDRARIVNDATRLLTDPSAYEQMSHAHNPYGDGRAAGRIVKVCGDE